MCPHAVPSPHYALGHEHSTLAESEIELNGFLPEQLPVDSLSDPYYGPWESLIKDLPKLLKDRTIRSRVNALPVLSVSRLRTTAKWRRAYVILSFLAHGYIWGGDYAAEVLPPSITVPLLKVSAHLELPPVATYASTCLWNFRSSSDDLTRLESLQALHTFTGTEDESWFYIVSVAMEAQGAHIIPIMLRAMKTVKNRDYSTITHALEELSTCIRRIHSLLGRMYEKCNPVVFYYQIRPFLAGSKNMAAAGLPRGVFYDEGDGEGHWLQLRGGSNGQSSLIQFLDIVLGVEHTFSGNSSPDAKTSASEPSFHQEVRAYMPAAHRQFLEHVSRIGSIRNLASGNSLPDEAPEQERLRAAFQTATSALAEFRNKHLGIVTRYIIIPSRRPPPDRSNVHVGLAGAPVGTSLDTRERGELTGTGGTALLPFLKQVRDETYQAGCMRSDP
ncbi:indoleamine 2,3-dioxygenase [Coniochaeta ligniaria NRRL 30616]|uniref:Indoleamine 2,3-dioxygenase n=1 Tax=Coniochaeta ligniaria NRRL 30616 TaxID=1408157 RepID=A0A1J7I611_9PEZI|nr:indoleamine 2,3-dioxygenase [Coniochaeta ligniaria NRRL 30616]